MGNRSSYQSITIYKDMAPQILELEKVEAGEILQAIMRYSCYGEDTDMSQYDRFVRSLWKTIKLKLDAGKAHDKEISETNSSNAKKRWEKEKGNATVCDRTQTNATVCDRTTITDTVTGTNSSTLTISSTVTNTDTEHACADSGSADRPVGAAAAEGAAPQSVDLFSVKQLLATAKKNKVNLTKEGIQIFHEEMQDSGWILYGEPVEKKYIVRVLREYAKKHPEYSLEQEESEEPEPVKKESQSKPNIEDEIYKIAHYFISQELFDKNAGNHHVLIEKYCPKQDFTEKQLKYMKNKWGISLKTYQYIEFDCNSEYYKDLE